MSSMDDGELDRSDREFERALLDSARADGPAGETRREVTEQAWARFAATIGAVSRVPREAGLADSRWRPGTGAETGAANPVRPWGRARWLVLGAVGGGIVVAAVAVGAFARWRGEKTDASLPAAAFTPDVSTRGLDTRDAPRRQVSSTLSQPPPALTKEGQSKVAPLEPAGRRKVTRGQPRLDRKVPSDRAPSSSLAAEVAALDAARSAASRESFDETLRLISQYRYDFPNGELAADADVVAIEALAAKSAWPEAARDAARFLAQYPNDPHAIRVRQLIASHQRP